MNYWLFILPVISALLGWIIHRIAARALFRSTISRRQPLLAEKLGRLAAAEFSHLDMEQKINDPAHIQKVMPLVEAHMDDFLRHRLQEQMPMISMFLGDKTIQTLKAVFLKEIETLFPQILAQFAGNIKSELDIEKIVTARIAAISPALLEKQLSKELRFIPFLGAIGGFLIGIIQLIIVLLIA